MNLSKIKTKTCLAVPAAVLVLAATLFAGEQKPQEHSQAPAQHQAAPSHPSAPSKPAGQGTPNRGSGGSANTQNRSGGGQAGTRPGQNTTRPGPTGTARPGQNAGTRPGQNTTRPGQTGNTRPGQNAGTKPGQAGGTRPGQQGGRPGGQTAGNRPGGGSRTTPANARNVSLRGGGSAQVRANGQIRSVNRNGMQISHGVHGGRTVVGMHNGARVVNVGRNGGYVQRAYVTRGGHAYYSRTYYAHGHYYVGVYRGYYWHGVNYYGYYPGYWYHPAFYGWAYAPWGAPVAWGVGAWGWGGPWWGFYAGWWNPYPVYAGPAFWLTDYLIAQSLQNAYAARQEALADDAAAAQGGGDPPPAAASNRVVLTPEVKQAIADEVKAQLAAQQAQAGQNGGGGGGAAPAPASANGEVPPALDPARRTFVVDNNLSVVANGQECGLSTGDVLMRLTDTPDQDNTVNASVSASQNGDCATGATVAVKVEDLQEMQNHFSEQLNNGMTELAKKQGTGGMPKSPDASTSQSDVPPPQPDTTAQKTLQDQQQAADQTEAQVKQEVGSGQSGGGR